MCTGWTLWSSKPCGRNDPGNDLLHFLPRDLRINALGRGIPALPGVAGDDLDWLTGIGSKRTLSYGTIVVRPGWG
jgi:hypothetical protein